MPATCLNVEPPRLSVQPPVPVIRAASVIGPCDTVSASAGSSYGNLGRPLQFQWALVSMVGSGVTSTDHDEVRQYLAGPSGRLASVRLPERAAAQATNVTLRVTVANFLATSTGTADVLISRSIAAIPSITMLGGELVEGSPLRPIRLQTRVVASPCIDASVQQ